MTGPSIPRSKIRDIEHLSPEERAAVGKAARGRVPRSSHAAWVPRDDRTDPIQQLRTQEATRMTELLPIRYGRMLRSPFAFYRGSAVIMASDLATTPTSGLRAQLCGDAHLANFGIYRSPERAQVFDINDFDETVPGPWEFDIKRLAASFEIALRERDVSARWRRDIVLTAVRAYREAMTEFAAMRNIDVWYARLDVEHLITGVATTGTGKAVVKTTRANLEKAASKDSLRALSKLTHLVDGEPRIASNPPLVVRAEELLTGEQLERFQPVIEEFLRNYRASLPEDRRRLLDSYRFADIARKVVGVGSVGARAWIVLMLGRDTCDPLFLQMKEATSSVLEPIVGRSRFRHHGRRVVEGQRLMQASSDVTLGWYRIRGFDGLPHDYYVRQLWDGKGSLDHTKMNPVMWAPYARVCGWTLARAHARSGHRIAISAYLGRGDTLDRALADFSVAYANQNERDYEALKAAAGRDEIAVEYGI
ncbi:MAG: DUF2252 domain-containing protein [Coriobacteriia bacterium]|nr:DUF2252 domain-containing protein [Coriobacteriia bacterium]